MRGAQRGPFGEPEGSETESRRLTPSIGLAPPSDPPDEIANEDFLFHLYRGSELLQDNRAHEAKEELERALHLQPNDAKGQDLLAVVYFRLGLYPRAISIYEQLRRSSPRDPAVLLNLALCYLKTGQAALARRDLELLLEVNPSHARAWGYLGLACERLGALDDAQRAFEHGGHGQMARRMADRRHSMMPASPQPDPDHGRAREMRDVVATALQELDAGELSFALAEPVSDSSQDKAPDSWRPLELGKITRPIGEVDSRLPDTRDGPPPLAPSGGAHRHTLMIGVPPPHAAEDLAELAQLTSGAPPSFVIDASGTPSLRRPVVAVAPSRAAELKPVDAPPPGTWTLPPPAEAVRPMSLPPMPLSTLTRESVVVFPAAGSVVLHPSGIALVQTAPATGFAARLEAVRASSNALTMKLVERQTKGKPTGESFGGVGSPLVHATGEGQLVLAPRAGRKLSSFALDDEDMCFVREEVLLGFDGALVFENGRLATGDGEFVAVVQLRGKGAVLLEAIGGILTLEVQGSRGLSVRREVILGWFGRLVPRALSPSEAPCGQRGLVSFAGVGRVLVASA